MFKTLRAIRVLSVGPAALVMLFFVNLLTPPGHWWVQWAALGIGIAWVVSLFRVIPALVIAGGLAALFAYFSSRSAGR